MTTTIVATLGSYWEFDEENKRYRRAPRGEGKRENPAWGDERAGIMEDQVWHPYSRWDTQDLYPDHPEVCPHLLIYTSLGGVHAIQAPKAEIFTPTA